MLAIQLILIASALALAVYFVGHWGQARTRAWTKLIFGAFLTFGVYTLLRPDDLTRIAGWVGVGRGADLVLYGLVVMFAFTTLATYIRFLEMEARFARLARRIALEEARREDAQASARLSGQSGEPAL